MAKVRKESFKNHKFVSAASTPSFRGTWTRTSSLHTQVMETHSLLPSYSARDLLRLCTDYPRLTALYPGDVAYLEKASATDPVAAFALGRYHQLMGTPGKLDAIRRLFDFSRRNGCPEGIFGEALIYRRGDEGMVDREKYFRLRDLAAAEGSICARMHRCKDKFLYYGGFGDIDEAISDIRKEIDSCGDVDPVWYELLGFALAEASDDAGAEEAYRKGAQMGCILAWEGLICFRPGDDTVLSQAEEAGCASAYVVHAQNLISRYDDAPSLERGDIRAEVEKLLLRAISMGNEIGCYVLGVTLYNGEAGFERSYHKARRYLSLSARMGCPLACSALADIIENESPADRREKEEVHFLRLQGLRLGEQHCLGPVVEAYREGYLQDYAREIEEDYIPLYDEEPDGDDGRWDPYV